MSIKRKFKHFKWLKGQIPSTFITSIKDTYYAALNITNTDKDF